MSDFRKLWDTLAPIGLDPGSGGYLRYAWSEAELACRAWFADQAAERAMEVEDDGNGNLFAWWGQAEPAQPGARSELASPAARAKPAQPGARSELASPAARAKPAQPGARSELASPAARAKPAQPDGAVLTGSHFDSVPHGGGYDGPLGIVGGFLAVDALRARGAVPRRAIGVVAFAEEEGARFGVPCLGSRLLTGALDPGRAAALVDRDGVPLPRAMGARPAGARPELLRRIGCFVELHIEQGQALAELDAPVAVGTGIWPHGRWRLEFAGEGNHAGTTRMADRCDPMLTLAYTVLGANKEARVRGAYATIGRIQVRPNATNAVPAAADAWLDARAEDADALADLVAAVAGRAAERATRDSTSFTLTPESLSPAVAFDARLCARVRVAVGEGAPLLSTAAGHDAGVLAAHVPTAMLFVRNPTGVSHAPAESATDADCVAGVAALATVLEDLAC